MYLYNVIKIKQFKTNIMNLLKDLGISTQTEAVETLKSKVLKVYESPSMILNPTNETDSEFIHDGFYTVSNENGDIHGKVSKKGSVLHMDTLIDIANEVSLENDLNLNFDKAKLNYFKDNSICSLNIPLGVSSFRTSNGFNDETEINLFIKTGFGGKSCTEIGVYSHRFVCSNGLEIRKGLKFFKSKHTEKMNDYAKVFLAKKIPMMLNSVNDFTQMAEAFDKTTITKQDIENFKQKFFNYKSGDDLSTKKLNQIEEFNKSMQIEMDRVGRTAWGLLQSATNYTNHGHSQSSKDFIITGQGATYNETAEKFILELV